MMEIEKGYETKLITHSTSQRVKSSISTLSDPAKFEPDERPDVKSLTPF